MLWLAPIFQGFGYHLSHYWFCRLSCSCDDWQSIELCRGHSLWCPNVSVMFLLLLNRLVWSWYGYNHHPTSSFSRSFLLFSYSQGFALPYFSNWLTKKLLNLPTLCDFNDKLATTQASNRTSSLRQDHPAVFTLFLRYPSPEKSSEEWK